VGEKTGAEESSGVEWSPEVYKDERLPLFRCFCLRIISGTMKRNIRPGMVAAEWQTTKGEAEREREREREKEREARVSSVLVERKA